MKEKKLLTAMTAAICGAWAKGYYQGIQDGASQPNTQQLKIIIEASCELAGITLSGDNEAILSGN
jgi:hypothetical protein